MEYNDDRTEAQRATHRLAWIGTDSFLSGWGKAEGGMSYAGWAFPQGKADNVERWVQHRGDMQRVRLVVLDGYRPRGTGHCHIYVVEEGHPAWNF